MLEEVTPWGQGVAAFQRDLILGTGVWHTGRVVIRSQAWGWEAPAYIELVAVLSIQDPPGAKGREPGENYCQCGRMGAELGEELTGSRPGSEWDPREKPSGALGSSTYQLRQEGRLGKGTLLGHIMRWKGFGLWSLEPREGGCHKARAELRLLFTWAGPSLPLVPRWAGVGGCLSLWNQGCACSSFYLF